MNKKQKRKRTRIIVAIALFVVVYVCVEVLPLDSWLGGETNALWAEFGGFLIPYLLAGYDVLYKAARNMGHGQIFDENFLMCIATFGAFALVLFPDSDPHMAEGAAVMLFYQVGELFQDYAVNRSRASIADMMDIAPDFANIERDGELVRVDPYEVALGSEIVIKPGERVPLDGVVLNGSSQLDTAALTGESVPREVVEGDEVISGCVNMTGKLVVQTTKEFGESTVSRILELVENASEKKARTENFITRFARFYTPIVVGVAVVLAIVPPLLLGGLWGDWVERALIFLVVSCPCALVISIPLSFFGGIGGASRIGILIKGSNYLETLANVTTIAFDKTGTLTDGTFQVVDVHPEDGFEQERLLSLAAHAEAYSDHPIATSVKEAYVGTVDQSRITDVQEESGHGVRAHIDGHEVLVGNDKLMQEDGVGYQDSNIVGTILHVALDGVYVGNIVIADVIKPDTAHAIHALHDAGITKTVMLTGDREEVAAAVANEVGLDAYKAQLLPQDKVAEVEHLLDETHSQNNGKARMAFVGDGINDAPVLMRADVGIAMGAMGSDAAIEAADIVLMDDKPSKIAKAVRVSHKTMRIVWQNIIFALGIKFAVLILAAIGIANMWLAVFADVGVCVIAIMNAMRAMSVCRGCDDTCDHRNHPEGHTC